MNSSVGSMSWGVIFATCGLALLLRLLIFVLDKKALHRRIPPDARLPPMPPKTSVWGHVEVLRSGFHRTAALEWSKEYGPVFRLKLNFYNIVILNSFETIKKFLNTKELLNRSRCFLTARDYYTGVGSLNGIPWSAHRKFCFSTLRKLGFAKTDMEDTMMEEFRRLSEKIAETNGEPVEVGELLLPTILNNIAAFFYGSWPPDHPTRFELHRIMMDLCDVLNTGPMFHFTPPMLRRLQSSLHFGRNGRVNDAMLELEEFSKTQVEVHTNASCKDGMTDFIRGYTQKIEQEKHDPHALFTYRYLVGTVNGFLIGGTFTTAITMRMHLVNFARSPDNFQARVQKEIDEVIGQNRGPTWADRKRMPFTMACVWELDRWNTAGFLGTARECSADVVIDGYFIPKGTVVLPNIWAVHNDPSLWKEPHKFNPGRFLNEDGSLLEHKPEFLIPFSIGRRSCPAETFASIEIFLMVTYLLQKFTVLRSNHVDLDLDSYDVFPQDIQDMKLRFVPRQHT